jgi:long-chain acyl-CoA synthetase
MLTLVETGQPHAVRQLADAWEQPGLLLVLPGPPHPVDGDRLQAMMRTIPPEFQQRHFALLTSGSTGTPKLVIGLRERAEALTRQMHSRQELDAVRSTVCALPLSYSYALVNQWLWSRVHDRALRATRGLADPASFFRELHDAPASMLCLVGSQLPLLRRLMPDGEQFQQVLRLNFAGGPFPQHELPWLSQVFPAATVFNNYGCTEALPRLCIRQAAESEDPASMGEPVDGVELRSAQGVLEFRSPYAAVAIAAQDGCRALADAQWISTGDLAEQLPNGRWRLAGRANEVFKRHGEKISLAELTAAVRASWPGSAAFYLDKDAQGEAGHVLVLAPTPDAAALRGILATFRRYRRAHWPLRVEGLPTLPLLAHGKPDVAALAQHDGRQVLWRQIG